MTLTEFWVYVYGTIQVLGTNQRIGQYAFNVLDQKRPDLAARVVGTDMDPFYIDDKRLGHSHTWTKFEMFLQDNW